MPNSAWTALPQQIYAIPAATGAASAASIHRAAACPVRYAFQKIAARPPSPCLASNTAMASFSELANLSADVVAKVEDSKEARPA